MLVSVDLGLSHCLIDGTERLLLVKQSPQTAVSCSCPPLHCSICSSDFIYQPLWIAELSRKQSLASERMTGNLHAQYCWKHCVPPVAKGHAAMCISYLPYFSAFLNYQCFTSLSCSKHSKFIWYILNAGACQWHQSNYRTLGKLL